MYCRVGQLIAKSEVMRMFKAVSFSIFSLMFLNLFGCQSSFDQVGSKAQVITSKIPLYVDSNYQLTQVQIKTLTNVAKLQGPAARFYLAPSVGIDGHLNGLDPLPKLFKAQSGQVIAGDLRTLELLTLYYHFEQLMLMDTQLGILKLNSWPRKVGLEARVVDKSNVISANNARYFGLVDAYLFDSFIRDDLNLTVNGGVIAHEHFHSIFFKMVLIPFYGLDNPEALSESNPHKPNSGVLLVKMNSRKEHVTYLIRAWNEGLADVWGWIYSSDTNFVQRSLSFENSRNLKLSKRALTSRRNFLTTIDSTFDSSAKLGLSYELGSEVARVIFHNSTDLDKRQVAAAILRILPQLPNHLRSDEPLSPSLVLLLLAKEPEFETKCQDILSAVPNEDLPQGQDRATLCQK